MYEPPEPILWPSDLPRPTIDQIKSAVLTSMQYPRLDAFGNLKRNQQAALARRLFSLVCLRVRGMSTPEIADVVGVASHSTFTNNGDWIAAYCRSSSGTASYNEIIKALIVEQRGIFARGDAHAAVVRKSLRNHAGGPV